MKKAIIYVLFVVVGYTTTAIQSQGDCDVRSLKNELIKALRPEYKYDSSKTTRFLYKETEQTIEIEAPLFKDEKFRFLFNTAALPKDIEIKFYDKKKGAKNRKQLFSLNDIREDGKTVYIFEPTVSKKIYLNYVIPRTTKQGLSGCMVCVIGYSLDVN
jgi:hypothetical protein